MRHSRRHEAEAPATAETSLRGEVLSWLVTVGGTVLVMWLLFTFVLGVFYVPSGSMLDTIHLGDRVVGERVSYRLGTPRQGDVVTFLDPAGSGETLIKRVIATPGQTVDFRGGTVYVDGQELDEGYTEGRASLPLDEHAANLSAPLSYPYVVPEGCIWVMGDNRTNSLDSRYFGAIPISSVTSHAVLIYWPFDDVRTL